MRTTDNTVLQQWQLNKYTWMSLGYALVYLPVAYRQHLFDVPLWAALVLFALGIASGCGRTYTAHHRGGKIYGFWSTFFNGAEIVLITAAVAITGGIQSDLWMLYFVVMIFESLYATRRTKLFLDSLWLILPRPCLDSTILLTLTPYRSICVCCSPAYFS